MTGQALLVATAGGLAAQLVMVIAGHYVAVIRDKVFAVGGMVISLAAGLVFAQLAQAGWPVSLGGGLVAGGLCALVAIGFSVALRDTPPMILAFGTAGSAAAGLVGGAVGRLIA